MERAPFRRRRYFIRTKFQLKYIVLILAVALTSAIISGYTIYYNSWVLLGHKLANVYPQGRLIEIFRSVNTKLAINLFFVLILCVTAGLLASHKIAGPLFRIIRFLGTVTKGDYSQRVTLRKGDELQDLADAVNKLVEKLDKEAGKKSA